MVHLTEQVKTDIRVFINQNMADFVWDAKHYEYLEITFATNDEGSEWNYQTGDNSFTGGCYGLPHWATYSVHPDTTPHELYLDIIDQLEELLPVNR